MMKREKSLQIPESLFLDLIKYFFAGEDPIIKQQIQRALRDKMEASVRHDIYSRYKTAATADQREQARKEYLERVGIPENFRW